MILPAKRIFKSIKDDETPPRRFGAIYIIFLEFLRNFILKLKLNGVLVVAVLTLHYESCRFEILMLPFLINNLRIKHLFYFSLQF